MTQIHSIDLKGTCLKEKQQGPYTEGGTRRLMEHLHMRDQRKQAKLKMLQRMRESEFVFPKMIVLAVSTMKY